MVRFITLLFKRWEIDDASYQGWAHLPSIHGTKAQCLTVSKQALQVLVDVFKALLNFASLDRGNLFLRMRTTTNGRNSVGFFFLAEFPRICIIKVNRKRPSHSPGWCRT